jgi:multiple sugar transport system ATP-binding protein
MMLPAICLTALLSVPPATRGHAVEPPYVARRLADGVYAVFGDNSIKIPEGKLKKFASDSYIGKGVIMGIRPENIHDEEIFLANAPESTINVAVEIVELMGSETYLYLKTSGKDDNIIARVDPRSTARGGDKIKVAFDANRLHFFDAETFNTILNR